MADGTVGGKVLTDYKVEPEWDCAKDRNKILDGRRQVVAYMINKEKQASYILLLCAHQEMWACTVVP